MKTTSKLVLTLLSASTLFAAALSGLNATELKAEDKQFLTGYTQVGSALAADDLAKAKSAAAALPANEGSDLAKAADLKAARSAFEKLSAKAEKLAAGQPDYHVFNCPMVKKDWVQSSTQVANPYAGKEMLTCGMEKK